MIPLTPATSKNALGHAEPFDVAALGFALGQQTLNDILWRRPKGLAVLPSWGYAVAEGFLR